jgi:hypothetical protein
VNVRAIRGSGIPETAITIATGLLLMFAMIRVALVGYLQLSSDGAAYLAAHEYTLQQLYSSSINAQQVTANVFPTIPQADVITSASPAPPSVQLPAIANYYSTFNQNARQGGITGVRPGQTLALVTPPPAASLNIIGGTATVNVSAAAIEPLMETQNSHYDVQGTGLNTDTSSDYFDSNSKQNMPPYFVGFHFMAHCTENSATCRTDGQQAFYELGIAAFLNSQNWNNTTQDETETTGVFCDVYYHQQYYVNVVTPILVGSYPNVNITAVGNNWNFNSSSSPLGLMYDVWDVYLGQTYPSAVMTRPNVLPNGSTQCQN